MWTPQTDVSAEVRNDRGWTLSRAPRQNAAVLQGIHGYAYARCDRRSETIAELNRLHDEAKAGTYVSHYSLAVIHAGLGNTDAALSALESAYDERAWTMFLLERDPTFDSLRNLPRFRRLARRVGLKFSS